MTADEAGPPPWARRLGFGGLIPFVGLATVLWVAGPANGPLASLALLGYGATIASFLGAVHWGLAMRERHSPPVTSLVWGVVPGLLGWTALLLGQAPGLLLAALLWACFAVERVLYQRYRLRAWLRMRLRADSGGQHQLPGQCGKNWRRQVVGIRTRNLQKCWATAGGLNFCSSTSRCLPAQ